MFYTSLPKLVNKNIQAMYAPIADEGAEVLAKSDLYELEKGRKAEPIGSKKTWGGKEYVKTASGWTPSKKARAAHEVIHGSGDDKFKYKTEGGKDWDLRNDPNHEKHKEAFNSLTYKDHLQISRQHNKLEVETNDASQKGFHAGMRDLHQKKVNENDLNTSKDANDWWSNKLSINEQKGFAKKHLENYEYSALMGSTSSHSSHDYKQKLIDKVWNAEKSDKNKAGFKSDDDHGIEVGKEYNHDTYGKVKVSKVEKNTGEKANKISHYVTFKTRGGAGAEETQGINGFRHGTTGDYNGKPIPVESKEAHEKRGFDESKGDVDVTGKGVDIPDEVKKLFDDMPKENNFSFLNKNKRIWRRDNKTGDITDHSAVPENKLPG